MTTRTIPFRLHIQPLSEIMLRFQDISRLIFTLLLSPKSTAVFFIHLIFKNPVECGRFISLTPSPILSCPLPLSISSPITNRLKTNTKIIIFAQILCAPIPTSHPRSLVLLKESHKKMNRCHYKFLFTNLENALNFAPSCCLVVSQQSVTS